jgi:tRNA U34 5-carboxymethylaminomethyl modifying GTPase MnmE/TrmE
MSNNLSYIEKMEYLYVLNETKNLLHQKLAAIVDDSEQQKLMEEDLQKIEQEIKEITGQNPEQTNFNALSMVFPYYEEESD